MEIILTCLSLPGVAMCLDNEIFFHERITLSIRGCLEQR